MPANIAADINHGITRLPIPFALDTSSNHRIAFIQTIRGMRNNHLGNTVVAAIVDKIQFMSIVLHRSAY